MALWLVRAGKNGEHEPRFFEDIRLELPLKQIWSLSNADD